MSDKGMFDQLNDALFAQMDKLQSVRPGNASTAINLMKFQAAAGDTMENRAASTPKMLTGSN